jgi:AmmeMemoRadiSam system protein B
VSSSEIRECWKLWTEAEPGRPRGKAIAALAPHAGWAFSGRLAALAVASLGKAGTVVVVGGHLPAGYPALAAAEEGYDTPLGALRQDGELQAELKRRFPLGVDRAADNTVEVLLPLVACAFPGSRVLWLRAPADPSSMALGAAIAEAGRALGRSLVVLGSTDLTHYGPDYDFEPAGTGPGAEAWVREESDPSFIQAALKMDGRAVLAAGAAGAACSSGAAACAAAFAAAMGCTKAELLGYGTSLELRTAPSFVGYCAIAWS